MSYYGWRTVRSSKHGESDREVVTWVYECLKNGDLRQGWSGEDNFCPKNCSRDEAKKHLVKWYSKSRSEKGINQLAGSLYRLGKIVKGDIILVMNIPSPRQITIVKARGSVCRIQDYRSKFTEELWHVGFSVPIKILTEISYDELGSELRDSIRSQHPVWSLAKYGKKINKLL